MGKKRNLREKGEVLGRRRMAKKKMEKEKEGETKTGFSGQVPQLIDTGKHSL